MAAEGMPPPLEDMTATLEQARKLRELRLGAQNHSASTPSSAGVKTPKNDTYKSSAAVTATKPVSQSQEQPTSVSPPEAAKCEKSVPSKKSSSGDFGGMKKGFLFGGSKSSNASRNQQTKTNKAESGKDSSTPQTDSIPFIKPKTQDKSSDLKLDEVQKAMDSTKGFLQGKEWVTEDLLEKVQKNETLSKRLGDPRFMQAVSEFQANPKEAMLKYQSNSEMQQFLKEFCGILGEHFSSLGDKEEGQKPSQAHSPVKTAPSGPKITELTDEDVKSQASSVPVDPHVQQILTDPVNREILMDPKIQQLIQYLRSDPEKAQRMLRGGDADFRQKVDRLISLGLLKFHG